MSAPALAGPVATRSGTRSGTRPNAFARPVDDDGLAHDVETVRRHVLRACGATDAEVGELLAYGRNDFAPTTRDAVYPLADEPCAAAWQRYAAESTGAPVDDVLRRHLVQLRFPVAAGISATDTYRAATRRGELTGVPSGPTDGAEFVDPDGLRLFVHPTAAGRIGVIVARARADFETLIRALTAQNEPVPIPASQGASIVGGYNNWSRVADERRAWEQAHPRAAAGEWNAAFRALIPDRPRYQDRFIVLSSGPYSGVPAAALGLSDSTWRQLSLEIRLEHECAHYVTRRAFGSMRNALLDELIADFVGMTATAGAFRADWFLQFMGLERAGHFRADGRLANYRGTPPLGAGAFVVLQRVVRRAAHQLAAFDADGGWGAPSGDLLADRARRVLALTRLTLEELASDDAAARLGGSVERTRLEADDDS